MHPLHDYIAVRIAEQIRQRHAVVIHDPRGELTAFFAEAADGAERAGRLVPIQLGERPSQLFTADGSFLQVREAVEPLTGGDEPGDVVIHLPGQARGDPVNSMLMEIEKAGKLYAAPTLGEYARQVLLKRHDHAAIDQMLRSDSLTYADLTALCRDQDAGGGSLLKSVFDSSDPTAIMAAWLGRPESDAEVERRGAWGELEAMFQGRLGVALPQDGDGPRCRAVAARYLLANEFREDLAPGTLVQGPAASALSAVPKVSSASELKAARDIAARLRTGAPDAYAKLADAAQDELLLGTDSVSGEHLGATDTFRFEEAAAVEAIFAMIANGRLEEARTLVSGRGDSFWVAQDPAREVIWQVCRLMIDLAGTAAKVRQAVSREGGDAAVRINRYAGQDDDAWFRLDLAQRRFETLLPSVQDEIDAAAVSAVRAAYDDTVRRMTESFVKALEKAGWAPGGVLHHTRIWTDVVTSRARPAAYVFVDAMRYEMGAELAERLQAANEVQIRPAIAALPSITPVGMAALLPGAAASFSVVEQGGRLGSRIEDAFLPDLPARQKFMAAKAPGVVDMTLDDVLSLGAKALQKRIGEAKLIVVRSTHIDSAGENPITTAYARRIMDSAIEDLARTLRNLAAVGVEDAVVTSDHGHLFFAEDRPASMRMDAPGGETVDLHRRCWIGRGGATPAGAIRVSGRKLGYNTDLDFVFPISTAVFKSGGDLAFHHGGPSLQELIVPVITVKARKPASEPGKGKSPLTVTVDFEAITNRIFTVKIAMAGRPRGLFDTTLHIRPIVTAGDRPVAQAAIAVGAELENGRLKLAPDQEISVGFLLNDDSVSAVRIQVLDADTDAALYTSPAEIPVKLGV